MTKAGSEAQLRSNFQPREGDTISQKGETPEEAVLGGIRGNSVLTHQTSDGKCKKCG